MKNYLYKKEVVYTEVMLPTNAPPGYADRATLWNAAEEVESNGTHSLQGDLWLPYQEKPRPKCIRR